ncbi:hypothetical protein D3C80_2042060 [compost metagenome]
MGPALDRANLALRGSWNPVGWTTPYLSTEAVLRFATCFSMAPVVEIASQFPPYADAASFQGMKKPGQAPGFGPPAGSREMPRA